MTRKTTPPAAPKPPADLRDLFAYGAMRELLADPLHDSQVTPEFIAERAWAQADAMMKARQS